jgi:hypothetical protein
MSVIVAGNWTESQARYFIEYGSRALPLHTPAYSPEQESLTYTSTVIFRVRKIWLLFRALIDRR